MEFNKRIITPKLNYPFENEKLDFEKLIKLGNSAYSKNEYLNAYLYYTIAYQQNPEDENVLRNLTNICIKEWLSNTPKKALCIPKFMGKGKGRGLVAKGNIKGNETILLEYPLLCIPTKETLV